jgi:hypothetical protein
VLIAALCGLIAVAAHAEEDGDGHIEAGENGSEELAKSAQNPMSRLISVRSQNDTTHEFGPHDRHASVCVSGQEETLRG